MIGLPGQVAPQPGRLERFRRHFLKLPFIVRTWIILPLLSLLTIYVVVMVSKVAWKSGDNVYQLIQNPLTMWEKVSLCVLAIVAIRWARRRKYIKLGLGRIIAIIAMGLLYGMWKLGVYIREHHTEMIGGITITPVIAYTFFILLPIGGVLFLRWAYTRKYGSLPEDLRAHLQKHWWWRENEFFILWGLAAIHWAVYTVWPVIWLNHVWGDSRIWILHAIFVFGGAALIPKGDKPYHHVLGKIVAVMAVACMIIVWIWNPPGLDAKSLSQNPSPAREADNLPMPLPAHADPDCLALINGPKFKDRWDLIGLAFRESNCNQFVWTDGKPDPTQLLYAHLKNGGRGTAVGIWQIKPGHPECAMFDITTQEGNGDCALALYQARGLEDWRPLDPSAPHVFEFPVTVASAEWSEMIKIPTGVKITVDDFDVITEEQINDDPTPLQVGVGGKDKDHQVIGPWKTVRFRTVNNVPAHSRMIYVYTN